MKVRALGLIFIIGVLLLAGCGKKEIQGAQNWPVKDFTYTNQDGKSFGSKNLKGKVWVADFVFTSCVDVCPPMTSNMASLQKKVKEAGIKNVEYVSFSVDPTVDKPETLKNYGGRFGVDFKNWNFLTGYSQEEIETKAMKEFKMIVKKPQEGDQVIHGTDFFLINQEGKIQKYYTGLQEIPYDKIIDDIKTLQ